MTTTGSARSARDAGRQHCPAWWCVAASSAGFPAGFPGSGAETQMPERNSASHDRAWTCTDCQGAAMEATSQTSASMREKISRRRRGWGVVVLMLSG
jgi:hypothetical protein